MNEVHPNMDLDFIKIPLRLENAGDIVSSDVDEDSADSSKGRGEMGDQDVVQSFQADLAAHARAAGREGGREMEEEQEDQEEEETVHACPPLSRFP